MGNVMCEAYKHFGFAPGRRGGCTSHRKPHLSHNVSPFSRRRPPERGCRSASPSAGGTHGFTAAHDAVGEQRVRAAR